MRRADPLFRIASELHRCLASIRSTADGNFTHRMSDVATAQTVLSKSLKRLTIANQRGWHLTGQRLKDDLPSNLRLMISSCEELIRACAPREGQPISLRHLIEELRQLHDEFEEVDLSKRGKIVAISEPIELEGIALGRFAIELHLGRLSPEPGSSCFDCVALDPNPASNNEETTHPHVQSNGLCAGEATQPIAIALRQGRICDAFCLVHSVLQTYNPNSPYVSLDHWDGVSCSDCGYSTDRDNLYSCDGCEGDFCEECISRCDLCESSRCRDCLERDPVSDQRCCAGCRERCATCKRIVDTDSFDSDSGLCPGCLKQRQAETLPDHTDPEPDTDNSNQENDDEYDLMPIVRSLESNPDSGTNSDAVSPTAAVRSPAPHSPAAAGCSPTPSAA